MKFGFQHYYKPTPPKMRKIGDTLLGIAAYITAQAITSNHPVIAYIALGIGIAGKVLTNMFTDDEPAKV